MNKKYDLFEELEEYDEELEEYYETEESFISDADREVNGMFGFDDPETGETTWYDRYGHLDCITPIPKEWQNEPLDEEDGYDPDDEW